MKNEVKLVAYNLNNGECMGTKESKEEAIKTIALAVASRKDFMEDEVKYYFQNNSSPWINIDEDAIEVDDETLSKIEKEIKKIIS